MRYVGAIKANHFHYTITQAAPPFAVASLDYVDPVQLLPTVGVDVADKLRWRQHQHEGQTAFENRIRADLKAEGITSQIVHVYHRGAAFERRSIPFSPDPAAWLAQFRPPGPELRKSAKEAA